MGSNRIRRSVAAGIATTAVLALVACGTDTGTTGKDPAAEVTPTMTPTPTESDDPTPVPLPSPAGENAVVLFLGEGPRGPVLFTDSVPVPDDSVDGVLAAIAAGPSDPDYRSLWTPDMFDGATQDGGVTTVALTKVGTTAPAGASAAEAALSLQQVAWTFKQLTDVGAVEFTLDGKPAARVLGIVDPGTVKASKPLKNLSKMNVLTPTEGQGVSGKFTATGTSNGFEAWVGWQLLNGDTVVKDGFGTAEGWMDKNYPWSLEVDVTDVQPGTYVLRFHTDDPSDGEGHRPDEATRTVTVE